MTVKVELGFTADGQGGPFFTLDDPVLGKLDNPNAFLGGGEVFVDVTEFFQSYNSTRGKSRELDRYQAGQLSVQFENNLRTFDPTYDQSPYYGQIVPKRNIRVTNGTAVQFLGVVEDWNISYDPGGQSIAVAQAFDSFSFLSGLSIASATYPDQETSERLNAVLDTVGWSTAERDIAFTGAELVGQTIESQDVLPYLQTTARSEPGDLFISKAGKVKLVGRNAAFTSEGIVLSDDGDTPYKTISAVYGSELLYNRVTVVSPIGTAVANNTISQAIYGERDLEEETQLDSQAQLAELADYLVTRYADPEFRFEGLTVDLKDISADQKTALLDLELADVVKVEFTPNNIGDPIERYGKVIGIVQNITPSVEEIQLRLQTTEGSLFVLGDPVFGRLDAGNLLGW